MSDWIERIYRDSVGWEVVRGLTAIGGRPAGSVQEREAAGLMRDTFESIGCASVRIESFPLQGWHRGTSRLLADGRQFDAIALPYSPSGTANAELVDLRPGTPGQFDSANIEGSIVLVESGMAQGGRFVHRREKYALAVEAGAIGFVYQNHRPGCLPRTGSIHGREDPIGEIPSVGVSFETGRRLLRQAGGSSVELAVDAETETSTSANVHGLLGPATDTRVLLSAHLDGHDVGEGALDNAVGVGLVAEIGRALAAREDELDTRVELVAYGAEEAGLVGSARHARSVDPGAIKAVVQLDGAGRDRELKLFTHGFEAFARVAERVGSQFDVSVEITPLHYLSSDHWRFVERGIPGGLVHDPSGGGERNTILTAADTLDKVDSRNLRDHAIFLTEFVLGVASDEVQIPHSTPAAVAAAIEQEGQASLAEHYARTVPEDIVDADEVP